MPLPRPHRPRRWHAWLLVPAVASATLMLPGAASPARAAEPVAGAQTSGDSLFPNVGNGGYDVANYDLDIAWTPGATLAASTIDATAAIRATTTGDPLSSYSFDFEGPNLTVSSVTVNGVPAQFTRDEQPMQIRHKLIVTPATPVSGEFTTVVTYAGVPSRHVDADMSFEGWNVTADGATFVNQPIGSMTGFPNNNTPSDKATYTLDIDIPDTITNAAGTGNAAAASNGELVAKVPSGAGRTTWRWVQQEQMASELVIISIGKYDVLESDITLASGRVLHEWSFVDSAISAATKTSINTQRARQKAIYDALETVYGPYPGNSVGVVVDTVPSAINYALETQDRSFFPSSISAGTLVHEIAHQWWGNGVAPKDWNDLWINEGMATWTPTYYNSVLASPPTSANSTHATYFNSWNSTAATSSNWRTPPARITNAANLYGYQTYTRSAQQWEALKLSIGDADFFAFVREWQRRYDGRSRGTVDYIALAEEISGENLAAFFQDWLYDADKPAWPQRYDLGLTSSTTEPVNPGDTISYTLTAANMGRVALSPAGGAASVVEVDLTDVLDDAAIDPSTLPAGLSLSGTTLSWTVPTTAAATFLPTGAATPTTSPTSTVTFPVVVKPEASQASITARADSATLGGFCGTAGCATSAVVPVQSLTPTGTPVVTGAPRVGQPLTATTEGWAAGTTFTYQWAVAGTPVAGATAATYTPVAADLGKTVTVAVTGSKAGYNSVTRTSAPSAPVADGPQAAGTPSVAGSARVGVPLTAQPGTWADGTSFTYQWAVAGQPVDGATAATFTPRPADVGETVTVAVTGTNPGYATETRTSAPSAPVAPGDLVLTDEPTVTGVARVGRTLTAVPGTWDDGVSFGYTWTRNGRAIPGATAASYELRPADAGDIVRVVVTGSKPGYAPESRTSDRRAPVALGQQDLSPTPRIAGTPRVGRDLTAVPGAHDAGVRLSYRWSVGGDTVTGPRGSGKTFTLRPRDRGQRVRVEVTATKPGYVNTTERSAATPRVR